MSFSWLTVPYELGRQVKIREIRHGVCQLVIPPDEILSQLYVSIEVSNICVQYGPNM